MLNPGQRHAVMIRPFSGAWWLGLLTTLLFAVCVNYIPLHLATATHLNDTALAMLDSVLHLHDHDHAEAPSGESSDGHLPHPVSDHLQVLASQSQTPSAPLLSNLESAEIAFQLPAPGVFWITPIIERIKPPGESPPGPAQPRAPPIA